MWQSMASNSVILAIVGMPGSGKSVAAAYLSKKGYPVLRFGDVTDQGVKEQGLPLTEENEKAFREKLRQELGMAVYAIKIEPRINETLHSGVAIVVLDGLYSWEEYEYLIGKFPGLKLLAVYAQPEIRYERLGKRTVRPLSREEARARDVAEIKNSNKGGPIAIADYLVINNADEPSLYRQLDPVLGEIRG